MVDDFWGGLAATASPFVWLNVSLNRSIRSYTQVESGTQTCSRDPRNVDRAAFPLGVAPASRLSMPSITGGAAGYVVGKDKRNEKLNDGKRSRPRRPPLVYVIENVEEP